MVGKYNGPDFGFVKNAKSRADKFRNFDESASHARKASIKKNPLQPDPNVLHKFASYNTLFTLSALSTQEIRNPKLFFNSAPHDIIAKSGGIGDGNSNTAPPGARERFTEDTKETIRKSAALRDALNRSTTEFYKNNDLYFKNVEMTSIPALNDKRRLTSVTNIQMELVEPSGLTLLEKVKGAAANNGFLDHLDAPYLLTIEFKGFDEHGKDIKENTDFIKRVIPIKLITMDIDVNQGGSYYNIKAIPYDQFALTDQYMYPRTSGSLKSTNRSFKDAVKNLQDILDEQNRDEQVKGYNQFPDRYDISISEELNPEAQLPYELLSQAGMTQKTVNQVAGEEEFTMEFIRFNSSVHIPKLLENLMKTHPDFGAKSFDEWSRAVSTPGSTTFDPNGALSTYFKYFRIRTAIEPTSDFDEIRQTNAKIIKVVVEPFYVSAYNLATAGIHQDKNYQGYVAKAYNYIFTGDNLDIQELNINYKVAYFQARLKDLEASDSRTFTQDNKDVTEETGTPTNTDLGSDNFLPVKSEASGYKTSPSNRTGKANARIDQFFDAITNPLADMVVVNMTILGDPAWLGQSQFIPATPVNSNGSSQDNNIKFFRGGVKDNVWNPKLKCFNYDVAKPITNLTFKVPQDFDDKTGVYEMSSAQQAVFSGLYQVTQVQHSFADGQFTQNLTMVRFNNQDSKVTSTSNQKITKKNGVVTNVKNPMQLSREMENIWKIRENDGMA
tara:strand:+ start:3644 stop:5818 length:2175 start_codon:yes stop_codon:yes gene_type:complete